MRRAITALAMSLVAAGCGGGGDDDEVTANVTATTSTTVASSTTPAESTTTTSEPGTTTSTSPSTSTTSPDPAPTTPTTVATATTVTVPSITSTTVVRRPGERDANLGPASWDGGRTNAAGTELAVSFTGGPPWVDGDPCTIDYRIEATETAEEVSLRFFEASPPPPDGRPRGCPMAGFFRQLFVPLAAPLGSRRVVALGEVRSLFDGVELAALGPLPEGWSLQSEGNGFQPYGSGTPRERFWARWVGPPEPESCFDLAPVPESGVGITEGPTELDGPRYGAEAQGQYDVRGNTATYWGSGDGGQVWLNWAEGGRGYSFTSWPSCHPHGTASIDRLLEIARGLVPPPPRSG